MNGAPNDIIVTFAPPAVQLKPVPEGRFPYRAAEGSAESAWKAFGFADAHQSTAASARAEMRRKGCAKRAASQALSATCRAISRDRAIPTMEQARAMNVESVVEGAGWDLSTKQLQVLTLARSGALRGKRRYRPDSPIQRITEIQPGDAAIRKRGTIPLRVSKSCSGGKYRHNDSGQHLVRRSTSGGLPTDTVKPRGQALLAPARSVGRGDDVPPKHSVPLALDGAVNSLNRTPSSRASESKKHHQTQQPETHEQAVALSRGGVRYGRMVYHRKGVKLTEDTPRSMRPRDGFKKAGAHLLCTREVVIGVMEGKRQKLLAALSATVRAAVTGTTQKPGGNGTPQHDQRRRGITPSPGTCHSDTSLCDRMRLDVRQIGLRRGVMEQPCSDKLNIFSPSPTASLFRPPGRNAGVAALVTGTGEQTGGSDDARDDLDGLCTTEVRPGADVEMAQHRSPEVAVDADPTHAPLGSTADCPAATSREHLEDTIILFAEDLTHSEVGALVGPALVWIDPFEEDKTIRELEKLWRSCLDSLLSRLRAEVSVDNHRGSLRYFSSREAGSLTEENVRTESLHGQVSPTEVPESTLESPPKILPALFDAASQASRGSSLPTAESAVVDCAGRISDESVYSRAVVYDRNKLNEEPSSGWRKANALRISQRTRSESMARTGFWLDRVLIRVGARVPWGRRHRGRFAKVLFSVSVGKDCRGLMFSAVSSSPTGDPMLRGHWEFRAADRDIARFLCPGRGKAAVKRHHAKPFIYDAERCVAELQERRELEWACGVIARKGFSLVFLAPGGVFLSLAGATKPCRREMPWPQDIEQDRALSKASVELQRAWRGWASRKRTRWVRMEREGLRRLSCLQKEAEEQRSVEAEATRTQTERRRQAQVVLAAAARGRAARQEASTRRALQAERAQRAEQAEGAERQYQLDLGATGPSAPSATTARTSNTKKQQASGAGERASLRVEEFTADAAPPGMVRLEKAMNIDGTEVELTADIRVGKEMAIVAVDKTTRRSSRLLIEAAEVENIVGAAARGPDSVQGAGVWSAKGAAGRAFRAVLGTLTLFKSRRKDLFILTYKGKRVVAPH